MFLMLRIAAIRHPDKPANRNNEPTWSLSRNSMVPLRARITTYSAVLSVVRLLNRQSASSQPNSRRNRTTESVAARNPPDHESIPELDWESYSEDEAFDMTANFRNHYLTLGLSVTAKLSDIRSTYLSLVARLERDFARIPTSDRHPAQPTEKRPTRQRMHSAVEIPRVDKDERTNAHHKTESKTARCQSHIVQQTAEAIVRRNTLDDAYSILAHPVRRKAYDSKHLHELQQYEKCRISQSRPSARAVALADAAKWRALLQKGCKSTLDAKMMGDLGWAAWSLEMYGEHEKAASATSMMSGEVVAGFVDLMEV
ncbi:hypothetical protein Tdes44962_MAKER04049 [Teratosphaeria destructans]|uniref:J domain-containing protein n=1 Tax=Teratosphaeria destructans TaxID=418781 RepID=A0A9W7W0B4_9PEZI|nr:hypothetical protein Tdes44962_MAKER04049 [Teratosphaeria destructans]